jgi:hypothetical protein
MTRAQITSNVDRRPNEPLGRECGHKVTEDCLICTTCERCREDLSEDDICTECDPTPEAPSLV